jgi:hypothetical protein
MPPKHPLRWKKGPAGEDGASERVGQHGATGIHIAAAGVAAIQTIGRARSPASCSMVVLDIR